jgi:hypothetical protein
METLNFHRLTQEGFNLPWDWLIFSLHGLALGSQITLRIRTTFYQVPA